MPRRDIFVLGASAGGLDPLREILSLIPADWPASLFVALHLGTRPAEHLLQILAGSTSAAVQWAEDQAPLESGAVYVAPANRHLVLDEQHMRVRFGPRECGSRPAIDMLFRSAAVAFNSRVAGIVLSGKLDDGAHGLRAIKRCGGLAVVMDPEVASEADMPRNAMRRAKVDYCLTAQDIGGHFEQWAQQEVVATPVPEEVAFENRLAQNALVEELPSTWNVIESVGCPDCGGSLRQTDKGEDAYYRCHLGHAFSLSSLLQAQQEQVEQALWIALRTVTDRMRVLERLKDDYQQANRPRLAEMMAEPSSEFARHYRVLRDVLSNLPNLLEPPAADLAE